MNKSEVYARLAELLPKLGTPIEDEVLHRINVELKAARMTWSDLAAVLVAEVPVEVASADVVAMIDRIETSLPGLKEYPRRFLADMREQAAHGDVCDLTPRQSKWLRDLDQQATAEHDRQRT